jgi:phage terminase small subunit
VKWKDETVDVKASELKKNDKVLVRLEELAQQTTSKAVMTITQRKEWLSELIESATEETKDKLKAVDILNKMDGAYVEKVEVAGQINNPMAGLTTDELKKLINDG